MSGDLKDIRVLVVDDSNTVRVSASKILSDAGYIVETASDGCECLKKVQAVPPEIIFLDIIMPSMDGYQTCALIKNDDRYKNIPVVMLSSKAGIVDKEKGRLVGSERYLTKPFQKQDLISAVEELVVKAA